MKRLRNIIQDTKAPSTSDLWINNGDQYLVDYIEV